VYQTVKFKSEARIQNGQWLVLGWKTTKEDHVVTWLVLGWKTTKEDHVFIWLVLGWKTTKEDHVLTRIDVCCVIENV